MSKLRNNKNRCNCNGAADSGIIGLQVLGAPACLTERVSDAEVKQRQAVADSVQRSVIPHLLEVPCRAHMGSYHSHPPQVSDVANLIEPMKKHKLTVRITQLNHGVDAQAHCAEVTSKHLQTLLSDGAVSVDTPNGSGTFRLASQNLRSISEMHFTPN